MRKNKHSKAAKKHESFLQRFIPMKLKYQSDEIGVSCL